MNDRSRPKAAPEKTPAKASNPSKDAAADQIADSTPAGFQPMPALTEADAKRLTLQLKLLLGSVADQIDEVKELISQAKSGRADVALGYKSWTAYCETEFAGALPLLERPRRLELVSSLTDLGMSSRAIAPIVRVTDRQVRKDQQVGTQFPPVPNPIVGAEIVVEDKPAVHRPQITGRDNKSYTPPAPRKQRRSSLPDSYRNAVDELRKSIERLERLHDDDRFGENRSSLKERHSWQVSHLRSRLFDLDARLLGRRAGDPDAEIAGEA